MNLKQFANREDWKGLVVNVLLSVGSVVLINALVFTQGWDVPNKGSGSSTYDPPGWLVGSVWVLLFALLGAARWLLVRSGSDQAVKHARLVVGLLVFCGLYPFYTLALSSLLIAFWGNLATIALAIWVLTQIRASSHRAAAFVFPLIVWVSFASVLTARMLRFL